MNLVLDTSERGLSVPSYWLSVLPEGKEQYRVEQEQNPALLQSGLCNGLCRGYCSGLSDIAARCTRSPDIPLNVSRSYLQSDSNVKKISTYITKKVSDRLQSIFKNDRKQFEEKWNDLKIFINYGMLTQEDFYDRAKDFALLSDTDDKYYTFEEYKTLIKDSQTDKDGNLIYLYANNKDEQYSYIEAAKNKGYNVLLMGGQLDVAW